MVFDIVLRMGLSRDELSVGGGDFGAIHNRKHAPGMLWQVMDRMDIASSVDMSSDMVDDDSCVCSIASHCAPNAACDYGEG